MPLEICRWECKECFVYQIPPRKTGARGHRADSWDLASPALTCIIKVFEKGDLALIKLYDTKSKALAACCEVEIQENGDRSKLEFFVESVVDSSRYSVLRVEDKKSKRVLFLGLGFRLRSDASNFRDSISDFVKYVKRQFEARKLQSKFEETVKDEDFIPSDKLQLKSGVTINVRGMKGKKKPKKKSSASADEDFFFLPPPGDSDNTSAVHAPVPINAADDDDWDDFGDFTSA